MSRELKKGGKQEKACHAAEKVVVVVKASKEIPKTALVWALTHVVRPGDCITLLVVVTSHSSGRKLWGFPRFSGDCANGHRKSHSGTSTEHKIDITNSCSQMILQLHDVYDTNKINVKIKIVSGTPFGSVAAEAKKNHASWVVLDKYDQDSSEWISGSRGQVPMRSVLLGSRAKSPGAGWRRKMLTFVM